MAPLCNGNRSHMYLLFTFVLASNLQTPAGLHVPGECLRYLPFTFVLASDLQTLEGLQVRVTTSVSSLSLRAHVIF